MEKKKFKLGLVPKLYCHHYWYPVWTVPSNWILPLCCNTVWILQYLLKIHHSTDDPCLCNHGNR